MLGDVTISYVTILRIKFAASVDYTNEQIDKAERFVVHPGGRVFVLITH